MLIPISYTKSLHNHIELSELFHRSVTLCAVFVWFRQHSLRVECVCVCMYIYTLVVSTEQNNKHGIAY
jgi:hypothetical protein